MDRKEKAESVASLHEVFSAAGAVVVTRNLGLTVAQSTALRTKMREAGATYKVAKNRLAKIALDGTAYSGISDLLTGAHASNGAIPTDIGAAISGGFLRVEAVDASTARIVLDTDGSGSGTATVPVVTLANLTGGFDAATLLTTLLNNDQLK